MKLKHILIFFACMIAFSMYLSYMSTDYDNNPVKVEEMAQKPKEKKEFRSKNSLYILKSQNKQNWAYFSFAKGKVVTIKKKGSSLDWDIAFQRANFISNGGVTNSDGNVGIINMGHVDINSIKMAPESGYVQDESWFGLNRNEQLNKWYKYRTANHKLTSKEDVYIIRTSDRKYAKMKILYYYCEGGKAGCITLEYFYQPDGSRNLETTNQKVNRLTN